MSEAGVIGDTIDQRAQHIEHMICWTDGERLRFQWYRLRIAVNDAVRRSRRATLGS